MTARPTPSFASELENRARELVVGTSHQMWEASPRGIVVREIRLALEQIRGQRLLKQRLAESIAQSECEIGTDLLQSLVPAELLRLKGQLSQLRSESRSLEASSHVREQELIRQLAAALDRRVQLGFDED